jgi:hypothetical protein
VTPHAASLAVSSTRENDITWARTDHYDCTFKVSDNAASLMLQPGPSEELGYHPFWEDTPMTLQVALVGTDGIVLASDKLRVVYDPVRHSSLTSKILVDPKQKIAIACAGYDISETVARRILSNPAPVRENWSRYPGDFESFAMNICKEDDFRPYGWRGELIIVSLHDLNHLLHLELREMYVRLKLIEDRILAGDSFNPAGFFADVYYSQQPIAQLAFLAAHIILSGGRFNPDGAGGLEVVKCTSDGFERLSESSIQDLIDRSDALDGRIRKDISTSLSLTWETAPA